MKKPSRKAQYLLMLLLNLVIVFALYFVGVQLNAVVTLSIYTVVFSGFTFAYFIYNRGFSRKGVTVDMLPDEWPPEKKTEFVEDAERRLEKSRWMLTVLLPLFAVFGYELVSVYFVPTLEAWLS